MRLFLTDMLALSGRLTDQPGPDTPRERFRRFLAGWPGSVDDLHALIEDGQRTPDDQSQRALMDLVVTLGRYLGFSVAYGVYDRRSGAVRFDGAWRSPGLARIVLEVRTDRTRPFSPDDLSRTIAALPDVEPAVDTEQTLGLCIADDDRRAALAALHLDRLALDLFVRNRVLGSAGMAGDLHGGAGVG